MCVRGHGDRRVTGDRIRQSWVDRMPSIDCSAEPKLLIHSCPSQAPLVYFRLQSVWVSSHKQMSLYERVICPAVRDPKERPFWSLLAQLKWGPDQPVEVSYRSGTPLPVGTSIGSGGVRRESCLSGEWLPLTWMVSHPNISTRGMSAFAHVLRMDEEDSSCTQVFEFFPFT